MIWAGEFGRTVYSQGGLSPDNYGRDHHPRCFTTWMAGGGVRPGITYGETDDYSYNVVKDPVTVRDFNATILHCLGIDHNKLTYKFQGLDQKLTGPVLQAWSPVCLRDVQVKRPGAGSQQGSLGWIFRW